MPNILLASDFDNTLAFKGIIPKENIEAIKRFRQSGNYFCMVTGRGRKMLPEELGDLCDYFICSSGGYICDKEGNVIYKKVISKEDANFMIEQMKKTRASIIVGHGKNEYSVEYTEYASKEFIEHFDTVLSFSRVNYQDIQEVVQISCDIVNRDDELECLKILNESGIAEAKENKTSIDCNGVGVNKALGIKILSEAKKFKHIYTIGDDVNDLLMNKKFESFAMSSGNEELKAISNYIVESVSEAIDKIMGIV